MAWRNSSIRYGSLSIWLHWATLALLVAVYACIELREGYPRGSDMREALKSWHFTLGLTVLALVVARVAAHFTGAFPRILPAPTGWTVHAGRAMHLALYAFMVAMPLAGWLLLGAEGEPVPFYGLVLPALVSANESLAGTVKEVHEAGGTIGYFLVGLHAVAALWHHYVIHDNTLLRMLPGQGRAD